MTQTKAYHRQWRADHAKQVRDARLRFNKAHPTYWQDRRQANPIQAKYDNAKSCATRRGIPFLFTFVEWVAWWGDDIARRGRGSNDLCMARNGDIGPYHPDNVLKLTSGQNARDGRSK